MSSSVSWLRGLSSGERAAVSAAFVVALPDSGRRSSCIASDSGEEGLRFGGVRGAEQAGGGGEISLSPTSLSPSLSI